MGTSDGTVKIRVDPADLERWRAAAKADLVNLSTFIRDSVNLRLGAPLQRQAEEHISAAFGPPKVHRPKARPLAAARNRACERRAFHRTGVYCKSCNTTP